jgi:hypothetical protein
MAHSLSECSKWNILALTIQLCLFIVKFHLHWVLAEPWAGSSWRTWIH